MNQYTPDCPCNEEAFIQHEISNLEQFQRLNDKIKDLEGQIQGLKCLNSRMYNIIRTSTEQNNMLRRFLMENFPFLCTQFDDQMKYDFVVPNDIYME